MGHLTKLIRARLTARRCACGWRGSGGRRWARADGTSARRSLDCWARRRPPGRACAQRVGRSAWTQIWQKAALRSLLVIPRSTVCDYQRLSGGKDQEISANFGMHFDKVLGMINPVVGLFMNFLVTLAYQSASCLGLAFPCEEPLEYSNCSDANVHPSHPFGQMKLVFSMPASAC
jgi:hypothetical protein